MITICKNGTKIGLVPELGGQILLWQVGSGDNLLDALPGEEHRRPDGWPDPTPTIDWDAGRGHIVWAGPQSTWWKDQEKFPDLSIWPPDPVLTAAPYSIKEQSAERIVLESSPSPYTGLQFLKTFEILPCGTVRVHVRATNRLNRPVCRNLWFNFRAKASGREYVSIANPFGVQIMGDGSSAWANGWHSLKTSTSAKAFIHADQGMILAEADGGNIMIQFDLTDVDRVPEGHAPVEIYRDNSGIKPALLEIEHHGPLTLLAPGESMEREETWQFHTSAIGTLLFSRSLEFAHQT
jgi:hypothetical protein